MTQHSMRSLAIGILLTTLIFSFYYYFVDDKQKQTEVNEDDVLAYVQEKNKVLLSSEEYNKLKDLEKKYKDAEASEQLAESKDNESKEETEPRYEQNSDENINTYTLHVESGMSSKQISQLLEEAHIINDAQELERYLADNNLSRKIQIGAYELSSNMSIDIIAQIITT